VCALSGVLIAAGYGVTLITLIVAVGSSCALVRRPLLGPVLLMSAVPALAGLDRGLLIPGFRISEVLIVGVALLVLPTRRGAPWRAFDWVALAYVLCTFTFGLFDLSDRGAAIFSKDLGTLVGPLEFLLLYRVTLVTAGHADVRRAMLKWMMLASVPLAVLGVMQWANVLGTRTLASAYAGETDNLKAYHTFYRAAALFGQGHQLGDYLLVMILFGAAFLFDPRQSPFRRRTLLAILALDGVALGTTATIAPIVAAVIGFLLLAHWYRRLGRALAAVLVAILLGALMFSSVIAAREKQQFGSETQGRSAVLAGSAASGVVPNTIAFRWEVWTKQYVPVIERHLVTGYGPDLPPGSVWAFTESAYVTVLLRGGLPLLALFGWLLWSVTREARKVTGDRRPVARAMCVLTVLVVFMQIEGNDLMDAGLAELWWGLAGVILAGVATERSRRAKPVRGA
jgi:hypothetical protein